MCRATFNQAITSVKLDMSGTVNEFPNVFLSKILYRSIKLPKFMLYVIHVHICTLAMP